MKIYATTYKWTPQFYYTSKSVEIQLSSLNEVIEKIGSNFITRGKRFIVYGDDINRTVFSDFKFN